MPTHERYNPAGIALVTLTLIFWSAVPLFLEYFVDYIDGWTANGWRYAIAALIWAPVLVVQARRGRLPHGLWRAALVPASVNCMGQCCFAWSPYFIDPGLLTFMLRFQIVLVAVGAYFLFPAERAVLRSRPYWLGMAVVVAGSTGTCLLGETIPRGATLVGIVLAVLAGVGFSAYSLSVRHFMANVHPVVSFAAICQLTALGLVTIMLVAGERHGAAALALPGRELVLFVASAVLGIAFAHVFYYASLARLGVAISAGVITLQPFCTGLGSYFLFGERLTPAQWVSGGLAVGGAVIMLSAQHRLRGQRAVRSRPHADGASGAR